MRKKIVMIGAGNLATHFATALHDVGWDIIQVFSNTLQNAKVLAEKIGACATDSISEINPNGDIYIISVKDDTIKSVSEALRCNGNAIIIHTAGSVPMSLLASHKRYGVVYPLQTFTKTRSLDFSVIPCFIEGSDGSVIQELTALAKSVSERVVEIDSHKRKMLHISAVFACNMVNHCYSLAEDIVESAGIEFSLLYPLIEETAAKAMAMKPSLAQTGPMMRNDNSVLDAQRKLLTDPGMLSIYNAMSESISRKYFKG